MDIQHRDFTIYEEATGRVVRSGTSAMHLTGLPDEFVGAGNKVLLDVKTSEPELHYVENGALVRMPDRPSNAHNWDYAAKEWVSDADKAWALVRIERDRRLRSSDWRVTKAAETGVPMDPAWMNYRQALRDITQQADPLAIVWPEPPSN